MKFHFCIVIFRVWFLAVVSALENYGTISYGSGCYGVSTCGEGSENAEEEIPSSGGGGVGGGSGGGSCNYDESYDWECSFWSECFNGFQTRTCQESNNCGTSYGRPITIINCDLVPLNLLDITFELESWELNDSRDLSSVTTFQNFGREGFQINLTYVIFDSLGEEVYETNGLVQILTDYVSLQNFEDFYVESGKYTVRLLVHYSNVTEEFEQDFQIYDIVLSPEEFNFIPFLAFSLLVLMVSSFFIFYHRRKNN